MHQPHQLQRHLAIDGLTLLRHVNHTHPTLTDLLQDFVRADGRSNHGIDQFAPLHFGISPAEALLMDPQQRLMLEVTWDALEDAGLTAEALAGSAGQPASPGAARQLVGLVG